MKARKKMTVLMNDMQRLAGIEVSEVSQSALDLLLTAMFKSSRARNMIGRWEEENPGFEGDLFSAISDVTKKIMDQYGIRVTGAVQAAQSIRKLSRQ